MMLRFLVKEAATEGLQNRCILKNLQNSQESSYNGVHFSQTCRHRTPFFMEHLRVNASTVSFCYVLRYSKDKIF